MQIGGIAAIVTGGGSGLGEATTRALAQRGASVAIFDLARSRGAEIAEELGNAVRFFEAEILQNTMLNGEVIRLDGAIRMQPR